jgi:hypothetical protein
MCVSSSVSPSFSEARRFWRMDATREVVVVRREEKYEVIVGLCCLRSENGRRADQGSVNLFGLGSEGWGSDCFRVDYRCCNCKF